MIDCVHWIDCGVQGGGCCRQGRYGGKPSDGVCRICLAGDPSLRSAARPPAASIEETGRKLWLRLHSFAAACRLETPADRDRARAELQTIDAAMPCGACRSHWRELIQQTPPDLASADRFFAWTVAVHNAVNRRLGKPQMPTDEALRMYGAAKK